MIFKNVKLGVGWVDGICDWFVNKWLLLWCFLIGVLVGIILGLGGLVVDWIVYGYLV